MFTGTQHGLGKLQSDMSAAQFVTVEKDLYTSDLLYVLSLSLAKVSIFQFLEKLCVEKRHKTICRWSSLLVAVWTVPVFFTLAFKCGTSSPWNMDDGHCIRIFDFWAAISPIDIATELVICILPIYIVKPVQISFDKKVTVIVAFVFRIFVIITTIARLIFMNGANKSLTDMNTNAFATSITTQLNLCVSLMTACIPCLKPFLDAFDSGMLNVSLRERIGGAYSKSYGASHGNSYALSSMTRGVKESNIRSHDVEDENEGLGTSASAFAVTSPVRLANGTDPTMAIQRTDQWSIRCEYVDLTTSGSLVDELGMPEDRGT
ncbi:hypothetical protein UA08_09185 [Talaromyces atroroseus]|uniref:Rhodopsin domain-containing protein n=1 Tax=Talaromyces atroroseus TaxID=1441469 RepID=A0A1Q5Q6M3_TALAT|nr:hypothetical protein UA08_09185 [Talaromyces atroroseus]OKL55492.1 hypothetical protein UA08_09185 [Talaromyces atroroseus]